ncbi:MAG: bifunctional adenosylcobinamide kinase/adenosylcobinamide-phosphate guanylyltransferase [Firmicutes bacterium]|nr:bifunctional adenosylcobinamide kinase/adenosylcobinamide-phosphate guanylyltransferase [Bacillota bacterium]
MTTLVIGGSGSGKSEFAESLLHEFFGKKYYIATMEVFDNETMKKAEAHRERRKNSGFETLECPVGLECAEIENGSAVIVECLTNLVANETHLNGETAFENIKTGIEKVFLAADTVVFVSGNVFDDNMDYSVETLEYMKVLAKVNSFAASVSQNVVEVVYSLPVYHKKAGG